MLLNSTLVAILLSFIGVLVGADLIVKSVDRICHQLKLSSFAVSFFLLGLLTSLPEFALGLASVQNNTPEIYMGNLIGGVIVIFFLIIPLLAIFGRGIVLSRGFNKANLLYSLVVMAAPAFVVLDKKVTNLEGILLIGLYVLLFFFIEKEKGIFDDKNKQLLRVREYSFFDILKVLLGVGIIFVASNVIVGKTLAFAQMFNVSTFYVSLIILALGTNLPEISLAIRAIVWKKKDIAFGDYIGSAAANTLLFGIFTLLSPGNVNTVENFVPTFIFVLTGLVVFYYFSRSRRDISRKEGFTLLLLYLLFVIIERYFHYF